MPQTPEEAWEAAKTTGRPEHWLYTTPDSHDQLTSEYERLQRTMKVLIAAGFVTENKAEQAYEIARTA